MSDESSVNFASYELLIWMRSSAVSNDLMLIVNMVMFLWLCGPDDLI
jgi:hypothetical protein